MGKKEKWVFFGILLAGLVFRLLFFFEFHDTFLMSPVLDAKSYLDWAKEIANGPFWGEGIYFQAPLYPYLMGTFFKIFGVTLNGWIGIQYGFSLVMVFAVYFTAKHYFGILTAYIAAALASVYPPCIYFDHVLLKTSLALCLMMAFLYVIEVKAKSSDKSFHFWLAGFLAGLAALNTETFLVIIPMTAIYLGWLGKRKLVHVLCFCIAAASIVGVVTIRNAIKTGDFILITNQGGVNFWIGNNPAADGTEKRPLDLALRPSPTYEKKEFEARAEQALGRKLKPSEVSQYWYGLACRFIKEHPLRFVVLTVKKLGLVLNAVEIPDNYNFSAYRERSSVLKLLPFGFGFIFALMVLGIFSIRKRWREFLFPICFILVNVALLSLYHVNSRYRMTILPPMILFAAAGGQFFIEVIKKREWNFAVNAVGAGAGVLLFTHLPLYHVDQSQDLYREALWEMDHQKTEKAVTLLRQCVTLNDQNAEAWMALGLTSLNQGDPSKALSYLDRSFQLNPYTVQTLNNRGSALAQLGRFDEAEKMFVQALKYDPESETARHNLALLKKLLVE